VVVKQTIGDVKMKISVKSGASLATLAAALMLAGTVAAPAAEMAADEAKGHCVGANACKGKSACKTATSACGGKNACKGQGFTEATAAECAKVEGAKFEAVKAEMKEMKK
jgi:hypothetical protein